MSNSCEVSLMSKLIGGIYKWSAATGAGFSVLILVTGVNETSGLVRVNLLSPDVELGGSLDLLVSSSVSGLAYDVLLESDVFGSVALEQANCVSGELGRAPVSVLSSLESLFSGDRVGWRVAGPPVLEKQDPRWGFKLSELARFRAVSCSVSATV